MGRGRGSAGGRRSGVVALFLALVLVAVPAHAELKAGASADEGSFWSDVGLGAGAGVVNILYVPVKLVYSAFGGVVGGLAYLVTLGSTETSNAIWEPTMGGTYVLTPQMLAGKEPLHFNGQPPMPPAPEPGYREYDSRWDQQ